MPCNSMVVWKSQTVFTKLFLDMEKFGNHRSAFPFPYATPVNLLWKYNQVNHHKNNIYEYKKTSGIDLKECSNTAWRNKACFATR